MKNNKGFTLIELLGVLVVLTLIILIAIPSITSTLERNKQKINEQKKNIVLSAAEVYANRYKQNFDYDSFLNGTCGIKVSDIKEKELITEDELIGSDNKQIVIKYDDNSTVNIENAIIKYNNSVGQFEYENIIVCQTVDE